MVAQRAETEALVSLAEEAEKPLLQQKVRSEMSRVPYNDHLEIWLQRVVVPSSGGLDSESREPICKVMQGQGLEFWNNDWVASLEIKKALAVKQVLVGTIENTGETVSPDEVQLFRKNA